MNDPETSSPGSTRTGALVELVGVKKAFPRAASPALHDFSARFQTGGVTGLVGPDGAGKTTLLRLVAGLLLPTEGSIHVDGLNPARESSRLRDILGYMPQKFGLYEDLTVQENLDLHADLRGVVGNDRVEAFRRLLEFTDLASFTRRLAGKLSGGMKQKLGLACALLGKPRLLLLDEPSVGVDPISRRELWRMVSGLASQGITIVWSTSYLDEAERCSHILLLNEGRLLFTGKPAEIHRRLENRCVRIENVAGNRRQLLTRALARPEVLDGTIQGHGVRLVLREGTEAPALAELEAGAEARIVRTTPRFEDGFIDLLGGGAPGESPLAQRAHQVSGTEGVVVEATDLTKKFGDFAATDSVSFCVRRGEVYGLLGPNGAGKSTTFRMLCGLLTPTSGIARVLGIDLKTSAARARQHLGYMAQKFSLYGTLSVRQNLEFFSGIYGLSGARQREVVAEMVSVFKLGPFLNTTPESLPLGYKQRLALSCALMHEPEILFLDEPTSGVDPITRREFWTHINGLVGKGVTIIVTTHFMDEAEYCDRIGLVFRGKLIAEGTPDELKHQAGGWQDAPTMEDAFIELIKRQTERGAGVAVE